MRLILSNNFIRMDFQFNVVTLKISYLESHVVLEMKTVLSMLVLKLE